MSRHHPDLVMCRKAPGISLGRLCDKCDGKCPVCDSYVRPTTLARICDECSFGNYQNKCIVCGGEGISDAFYCFECTRLEKDRDGCPKIINLGSSRTDLFVSIPLARSWTYANTGNSIKRRISEITKSVLIGILAIWLQSNLSEDEKYKLKAQFEILSWMDAIRLRKETL
jgi:PHD finger-like domain-containing protein 5A